MHLFFNGFTFFYMAPLVLSILGNFSFLGLYLGGTCASVILSFPSLPSSFYRFHTTAVPWKHV